MRPYVIFEAPSTLGLWPSGVELLPTVLLAEGLGARLRARHGGVIEPLPFDPARDVATGLLNPTRLVEYAARIADALGGPLERGEFPIVLGGDCSIMLGTLLGLRRTARTGLLFIDGQADFYQPSAEPKGEAASMDLALATGRGPSSVTKIEGYPRLVADEDVVVLGFRDAEDAARHGSQPLPASIKAIDLAAVRSDGAANAVNAALSHLARDHGPPGFWIHLDADVLDDAIMPAVDYRMPGGLSWDELTTILRAACASPQARGMEVCIYNPSLDPSRSIAKALVGALVDALSS